MCNIQAGWFSLCHAPPSGCLSVPPGLARCRHPGQHLPGVNHPAGQLRQLDRVLRQRSRQRLHWAVWRRGRWRQGAGRFSASPRPRPCPQKGSRTFASHEGAGARARWGACCLACRAVHCIAVCGRCRGGVSLIQALRKCSQCTATSVLLPTVSAAPVCACARAAAGPSRQADCYEDPRQDGCRAFQQSDATSEAAIRQICGSMPSMLGCGLWQQCSSGAGGRGGQAGSAAATAAGMRAGC